jgi:hypothetical protein
MSRYSMLPVALTALTLAGSVAQAQTVNRATIPQTATRIQPNVPALPPGIDTTVGSGTGAFMVWVGEPVLSQSTYFGTASSLSWQNASGTAVQTVTTGMSGTVNVYFAKDNALVQNAVAKSCFVAQACQGPGFTQVVFTQFNPGSVTRYVVDGAKSITTSAAAGGGGISVITFQRLFVETRPTR